ncbi:MAG: hypothetical protein HZB51_32505 [Chloroflexi bacterium]|nr:hypothetical protein [Chloroflexota bacterium]
MISREVQERYMADSLNIRLGGLAADLARIVSFSKNIKAIKSVEGLLNESIYFIEWSAPDLLPERLEDAAQLVDIQRDLAHWRWIWNEAQNDPAQRAKLAEQAQAWSDQVLEMSGLLNEQ